jgi:hypothetical protein
MQKCRPVVKDRGRKFNERLLHFETQLSIRVGTKYGSADSDSLAHLEKTDLARKYFLEIKVVALYSVMDQEVGFHSEFKI